jgi:hypothetical protein
MDHISKLGSIQSGRIIPRSEANERLQDNIGDRTKEDRIEKRMDSGRFGSHRDDSSHCTAWRNRVSACSELYASGIHYYTSKHGLATAKNVPLILIILRARSCRWIVHDPSDSPPASIGACPSSRTCWCAARVGRGGGGAGKGLTSSGPAPDSLGVAEGRREHESRDVSTALYRRLAHPCNNYRRRERGDVVVKRRNGDDHAGGLFGFRLLRKPRGRTMG